MKIKKSFKKTILTVLIVALMVSACGMLFACNKDDDGGNVDTRRVATNKVQQTALSAVNPEWKISFTDSELAARSDGGDYVTNSIWTNFVGNALYSSSLQTAKIDKVAKELQSDLGKKIISGAKVKTKDYFDLFVSFGFTSSDVSNLIYGALYSLNNNLTAEISSANAKLLQLYDLATKNGNTTGKDNISLAIASTSAVKQSLTKFDASRAEINTALVDAKTGLDALVATAFQLSTSADLVGMINDISSGALENITDSEIETYIGSIKSEIGSLKNKLTPSETAKLESMLSILIKNLDGVVFDAEIFDQLTSGVRLAYIALDYVPTICDLVVSATDAIDSKFIAQIKQYATNQKLEDTTKHMPKLNQSILIAKLISSALNGKTKDDIKRLISDISTNAGDNYEKIIQLYMIKNASLVFMNDFPPDETIMTKGLEIMAIDGKLRKFKMEYAKYAVSGDIKSFTFVYQELDVYSKHDSGNDIMYSEKWFSGIVDAVTRKLAGGTAMENGQEVFVPDEAFTNK
ncbi:MAG: hypothetical protein RR338_04515, partial [Clostridia bacterium]